ncbi:hypothetical protein AGABI1DRAFT_133491 [Agaricus bisporus var. burnettii JB137-S8]|uniref:Uncharacterized protein n=1 Tax=Agaricus bisporus var. burnettii (strain JB137-S8 / ATCC MYA-4627 / FGSC 10392) TaxID=597362 RepID=K5XIE7_AGABU|nr:uncharacterized protein AGABI1DRAFT_133491 [Agaricus bisporus var. burnettii JB137-S8]EKM74220.1 hypothetical protein AGABI1DRAFT_133491 [Agaricus bisporus var. burnettii JB137-S8]
MGLGKLGCIFMLGRCYYWMDTRPGLMPPTNIVAHELEVYCARTFSTEVSMTNLNVVDSQKLSSNDSVLVSYDWRARHAHSIAATSISEGTDKVTMNELGKLVDLVTPMFRDFLMLDFATQLVNACALVSYLSTAEFNYAPTSRQVLLFKWEDLSSRAFRKSCKNEIVTNYSPYSSYPQRPQTTASHISIVFRSLAHNVFNVRSHTAAALINFCEGIETDTIISYLDPIVECLGL